MISSHSSAVCHGASEGLQPDARAGFKFAPLGPLLTALGVGPAVGQGTPMEMSDVTGE